MRYAADQLRTMAMFQSAPDREAGRCTTAASTTLTAARFNPRPTVRPGDAQRDGVPRDRLGVSIRARP